jgi:HlyD family secretion protein
MAIAKSAPQKERGNHDEGGSSKGRAALAAVQKSVEHLGGRIQADPRDFRPALVRLQESPPSPLGRRVLWAALIFLAGLLVWGIFGQLDIVAVAEGKLVPDTYLKIVQPTDAGVVKQILVTENQAVKAGQVLIRMDTALSESDLKAFVADYHNKRIALRRIDAQLAGAPFISRADEPAALFAQVFAQYTANRRSYEIALAQERAILEKAKHDLTATQEVRKKLVQTLPHYREQEAAYEKLQQQGFAGRLMHTDKQRELIEKEQDLRAQEAVIASAQDTIRQEQKKIDQITADYRRQLQTERVDIASQLEKASQEMAKQEHRNSYLELKAPQDGVVKDLATHTVGTVTSPGTILMTLVPRDENLRAEVWVKNDDIGFIHPSQRVKVKIAAFTFQKYGMVQGKVAQVSADASEQGAGDGQQGQAKAKIDRFTYKTLIDIKSQLLDANGEKHRLAPGMQVSAEIHLGTRSVLEYLLSPVTKAFHEAARER